MTHFKLIIALLLASLILPAGAADYDTPDRRGRSGWSEPDRPERHRHGPSVERVAMNQLLAQELAQRSGRPASEISAMLKVAPPLEVAEELGLERKTMREAFTAARSTLITRMQQAQLITAEEAKQLLSEPMPRPREGHAQRGRGGDENPPPEPEDAP